MERKIIGMDAPVRIENRSQLIYLLTEAAELEHGIMCCYLFAAFSIKSDVNEGVTAEQLSFIRRWRGNILQIAMEEMVHLSLACNLLTAVGGSPHLGRPNLPISPKAYPPSFSLELVPFGRKSLESFIMIERPEDEALRPGADTSHGSSLLSQVKISDSVVSRHDELVHGAVRECGGEVYKHTGDAAWVPLSRRPLRRSRPLYRPSRLYTRRTGALSDR